MFGGLLSEFTPEATCLACHGPLGIATEVTIHDPRGHGVGNFGYITCLECHNPHSNGDPSEPTSPTPRPNILSGYNVKLLGMEYDANYSGTLPKPKLLTPQIREETTAGLGPLKDVVFQVTPDDWHRPADSFGVCNACHVAIHNEGKDCRSCHSHSGGFAGAGCTGCHTGEVGSAGALKVSSASPHSETITGYSCEACHVGHGAGTIVIPNNPAVGINYSSNGETGISLGSATVTGTTEAEICWNCHAVKGVSEWGTNTRLATGNSPYNYGDLNQSNWLTATWSSANFSYKTGLIVSTHTANPAALGGPTSTNNHGQPNLDTTTQIRCSYCHDVHELALAPNDTAIGKPYLRGTWIGNPYKEDGAPSNIAGGKPGDIANYAAYDIAGRFGAVPRGGTAYTALGGYFIDQNSGNPTTIATMNSPDKFAGLCRLCHEGTAGTAGDGIWQAAEINALNTFGTASDDWVGNNNGHAAVVKGGSGVGAFNLFTVGKRHQTAWSPYTGTGSNGGNPVMAYRNARIKGAKAWGDTWAEGLRGTDSNAFQYLPRVDSSSQSRNFQFYNWGATVVVENSDGTMSDSGINTNFHQFTCSKCHSPHASRLPRLLITNCLDTEHNTWDNTYVTPASDSNGAGSNLVVENQSVSLSQVTSAQNCHRLADPAYPQARPQGTATGGWNRVSPW